MRKRERRGRRRGGTHGGRVGSGAVARNGRMEAVGGFEDVCGDDERRRWQCRGEDQRSATVAVLMEERKMATAAASVSV